MMRRQRNFSGYSRSATWMALSIARSSKAVPSANSQQVGAALRVLARNEAGFFLMVESGMIDKYTHLLDMERAVYDTIMLDNAVRLARDWASARGDDTLILVLADHNHPVGLVGTIEDDMS